MRKAQSGYTEIISKVNAREQTEANAEYSTNRIKVT